MIDPKKIALQVALRAGQLQGASQAGLEIAYQHGYMALDGGMFPASAIRDCTLAVEAELAEIIANDKMNPYRSLLYGRSADLLTNSKIPTMSGLATVGSLEATSGSESDEEEPQLFIGAFSQINDSVDHTPLTETTVQEIRRYYAKGYQGRTYKYVLAAGRIMHTRGNCYFEGCIYSQSMAEARFDATAEQFSPLPASLESVWIARAIEFMSKEGFLVGVGGYYGDFARSGIERLKARELNMPVLPTSIATALPGSN